jgi:hypothetical protein
LDVAEGDNEDWDVTDCESDWHANDRENVRDETVYETVCDGAGFPTDSEVDDSLTGTTINVKLIVM